MSRVITAEAVSSAERWAPPSVSGPLANSRRDWRTVEELAAVERTVWDESYAAGRQAGLAAGETEIARRLAALDQRVAQFESVLNALARPLEKLDDTVEGQLVELALAIARQIVRRELKADPTQVLTIVRETIQLLPVTARDVQIFLHPDDAALVRERLAPASTGRAWSIAEDPMLTRGGCRVTSETGQIDARLEAQLASIIGAVLGEDRGSSRIADTT